MTECCCDDIIIEVNEEGVDGVGIASIELVSTVGITKNYRINLTNGTYFDYSISDGSSIASISKTSSAGLVDTYTVLLTSGDTTTFEVTNGNGIASIVKTSTDNLTDTYTISYTNGTTSTFAVTNGNSIVSVSKVSTQVLTDTYEITYTDEDKSPDSFTVVNGRGITSIAKTSTSGLVDTYTITYNDSSTSTFTVTNGAKGDKGDTGDTGNGIQSIALLSESGLVKTYRITMTDGTHFDFNVTDGEKGDTGETGATGNGIASIEKTATVGLVDTYTITMTDGTTSTFDVTNGSDEWGAIVGNLSDQTDLQNALDSKAPAITETASGSIASFTDGSTLPVESLTVAIEPVQAGTGDPSPDNVRPISGWSSATVTRTGKNLLPNLKLRSGETRVIIGQNVDYATRKLFLPIGTYTLNVTLTSGAGALYYRGPDSNTNHKLSDGLTGMLNVTKAGTFVFWVYRSGAAITAEEVSTFQLELGSSATDYEAPSIQTVTIDLDGTRYGGTLNVLTGEMTVTKAMITKNTANMNNLQNYPGWKGSGVRAIIGSGKNTPLTIMSNIGTSVNVNTETTNDIIFLTKAVYGKTQDEWIALAMDVQMVFDYATPLTVQLTPSQMQTLLGTTNNIWADTGDVEVTYRADTKLFIQEQIAESQRATRSLIAGIETEMVASKNYVIGDLLIVGDTLYTVTANIGSGSAITVGTNVTVTTVAEQLLALANA